METGTIEIAGLRIIDGSEVIAQRHLGPEYNNTYSSMLRIVIHPNGQATMVPYTDLESFDQKLDIKEDHIIVTYKPQGAVLEQYKKFLEALREHQTGIHLPENKIIT